MQKVENMRFGKKLLPFYTNTKQQKTATSEAGLLMVESRTSEENGYQLFSFQRIWYNVSGTVWRVVFALKKGGESMTAYEIASLVVAVLTLIAALKKK